MRPFARVFAELRAHYFPRSESPEDDRAFAAWARGRVQPQASVVALAALAFLLLWWPLDGVVVGAFPELRGAFLRWRVGGTALALVYLLSASLPFPRARLGLANGCMGLLFGWATAHAGGLHRPWAHVLQIMTFSTLTVPLTPAPRALITAAMGGGIVAGLVLGGEGTVASPYFPFLVSMLVAMMVLSAALGHSQFLLARKNFLQEQELTRHGAQLEAVVAARTEELRAILGGVESAREEERARVSRDLHDALGQELAALRYSVAHARRRYETEPGAVRGNLAELDALIAQMTSTTRAIMQDLRPRILDDLGLPAAAAWLVRSVGARVDARCEIDLDVHEGAAAVPPPIAAALFRVLQEALHNAARHAQATEIRVSLGVGDGVARLTVRDDGVGITRDAPRGSLGLLTMRERVEALGGEFSLRTRPAVQGTELRAEVPLSPSRSGP